MKHARLRFMTRLAAVASLVVFAGLSIWPRAREGVPQVDRLDLLFRQVGAMETPAGVENASGDPSRAHEILVRADEIQGIVVSTQGQAVEGAWVYLLLPIREADPRLSTPPPMLTDAAGSFRFTGLAENSYSLRAHDESSEVITTEAFSPGHERIRLVLECRASIIGHVWSEDGAGAAGATVTLKERGVSGRAFVTACDSVGSFAFRFLQPGRYCVTASLDGQGSDETPEFALVAEQSTEVGLTLRPGPAICGRALDDQGLPVAGVMLQARATPQSWHDADGGQTLGIRRRPHLGSMPVSTRASNICATGADGEFCLYGLERGWGYEVVVASADYCLAASSVDVVHLVGTSGVQVRLVRALQIRGRVVQDCVAPLKAQVSIQRVPRTEASGSQSKGSVACDESGSFTFDHLLPGTYELWAQVPDGRPSDRQLIKLFGYSVTDVTLEVSRGVEVTGRAFLPSGELAAGYVVSLRRSTGHGQERLDGITSDEGWFRIGGTEGDATYAVHSYPREMGEPPGGSNTGVTVGGGETFEFTVATPAKVVGRVLSSRGDELSEFDLLFESARGPGHVMGRIRLVAVQGGQFSVSMPQGTSSSLLVLARDHAPCRVQLPDAVVAEVDVGDIHLAQGSIVKLQVLDENGAPVAGASLSVALTRHFGATNASGEYALDHWSPLMESLAISATGYASQTVVFDQSPTAGTVRIVLERR